MALTPYRTMSEENKNPQNQNDASQNSGSEKNDDVRNVADNKPETNNRPTTPPAPKQEEKSLEEELAGDLEASETEVDNSVPKSEQPAPAIDINQLINNPEMLRTLQAAMAKVPTRPDHTAGDKRISLRRMDGKYVVDYKNCFQRFVMNEEQTQKVQVEVIPVRFHGEKEFTEVNYKEFIASERVQCKVNKTFNEELPVDEGETYDDDGALVQMIRKENISTYILMTPEGDEITIQQKVANA